MRRVNISTNI